VLVLFVVMLLLPLVCDDVVVDAVAVYDV